jgi:hypothetical protein
MIAKLNGVTPRLPVFAEEISTNPRFTPIARAATVARPAWPAKLKNCLLPASFKSDILLSPLVIDESESIDGQIALAF